MTESSWFQALWLNPIYWREPVWLLLALQPFFLYLLRNLSSKKKLRCYADPALHPWAGWQQTRGSRSWKKSLFTRESLYTYAWILLAISMAGPRLLVEQPARPDEADMNIMLVVDVSRSMQAIDVETNRLHRVQIEINELLQQIGNKRVGLILYTARAHLLVPFTSDISALKYYLNLLESIPMPTRGSSPVSALELAQKEIDITDSENKSVIIWFTDGDFDSSDYESSGKVNIISESRKTLKGMARHLASRSIPLYILGVGSSEGEAIPMTDGSWLQYKGRPVISRMNEKMLTELAALANGRFMIAQDDNSDWEYLYQQGITDSISQQNSTAGDSEAIWQELYPWTLFPAITLLFASLLPSRRNLISSPQVLLFACLLFILITPSNQASASDTRNITAADKSELERQAYHFFINDEFSSAARLYHRLAGYNARLGEGSCYYRIDKYQLAIAQFSQAIMLADTDLQRGNAVYNLANATFMTGDYLAATELYRDALTYQPADKSTLTNLAISRSLHQLVIQQLEQGIANRMGSGPRSVRAKQGLDINDQGALSFDSEEQRKITEIPLPAIPSDNLQKLLAKGLAHARLASENTHNLTGNTLISQQRQNQDINAARIRMRELDDNQLLLWKRLFEMEEGFAAPVEESKMVPGISPW